MTCLPPISTEGLTVKDVDDLAEKCKQQMLKVFHETTAEVRKEAELNGESILEPIKPSKPVTTDIKKPDESGEAVSRETGENGQATR